MPRQEPNPALVALGEALRLIREEKDLSIEAVAVAAGISPARLVNLEAGRVDPDFELMLRLADALNTRLSVIVGRAGDLSQEDA
jgi:transcriptional regulator with XRE-family HTH domain